MGLESRLHPHPRTHIPRDFHPHTSTFASRLSTNRTSQFKPLSMNRRSRNGCIDCKKSKIKCDERRPHCGTCARRNYSCRGYSEDLDDTSHTRSRFSEGAKVGKSERRQVGHKKTNSQVINPHQPDTRRVDRSPLKSHFLFDESSSLTKVNKANNTPLCSRIFSIPQSALDKADEPTLELYFLRHPSELVISDEFVDEMNANVLQVFLEDPEGVCESLSSIGYVYLESGQELVLTLGRKARILARLRDGKQLEQMLLMLLGLCAVEVCLDCTQYADAKHI